MHSRRQFRVRDGARGGRNGDRSVDFLMLATLLAGSENGGLINGRFHERRLAAGFGIPFALAPAWHARSLNGQGRLLRRAAR